MENSEGTRHGRGVSHNPTNETDPIFTGNEPGNAVSPKAVENCEGTSHGVGVLHNPANEPHPIMTGNFVLSDCGKEDGGNSTNAANQRDPIIPGNEPGNAVFPRWWKTLKKRDIVGVFHIIQPMNLTPLS